MKFILPFFLVAAFSCSAQEMKLFSKSTFSVPCPATWRIKEGSTNLQSSLLAPNDSDTDQFVENLNVVIETLPDNSYDAQKYAAFSKGYLPQKIKKFQVLENKKASINGKDSWYMVFKGYQNNRLLQWKQYYIVYKQKVHILTFTAEFSMYKDYVKTFTTMATGYIVK